MRIKTLILTVLLVAAPMAQAVAESLWREGANLFSDRKARNVGDLVTIIISESATASHSTSTERGKEAKAKGGPEAGLARNLLGFIPPFGAEGKTEYKGEGKTSRSGTLRATMTARIVNILPDGNLAIEGRRTIRVNAEEEEIILTGIVRPDDIRADNTVRSSSIANVNIKYRGGLSFSDKERPGLITRLLTGLANLFF